MVWRIGNSSTIQVWHDPCLPIPHNPRLQNQPTAGFTDIRMEDLLLSNLVRWNIDLICTLFDERDVDAILQIPLSIRQIPYHLGWKFTESGQYSVKSSYRLARH